jgi:chromosome segregation ATPase
VATAERHHHDKDEDVVRGHVIEADSAQDLLDPEETKSSRDSVRLDDEGRFVDEDADTYRSNKKKIHKIVDKDYIDHARVDGLTFSEWQLK